MKNRIRVVALLVLIAAAGIWQLTRTGTRSHPPLAASGSVEATDADLGFQIPGRVLEVLVAEGTAVQGGAELARLDARELDAALQSAQAQLTAAEARLAELTRGARPQELAAAEAALRSANQRAEEAVREMQRARTLYEGGAISRQLFDSAETRVGISAAELDQAEQALGLLRAGPRAETIATQRAVVEQAHANVAKTEAALANAVIRAPFSGVVTVRHREPGEAVTPGAPVLTLLDPQDRWVRIYVRADQVGRVRLGTRAEIVSDTYPDRPYAGEIVFVGDEAEFTPRNVQTAEERTRLVYPVKVRIIGDPEFALKPGIPADVTLLEPGS